MDPPAQGSAAELPPAPVSALLITCRLFFSPLPNNFVKRWPLLRGTEPVSGRAGQNRARWRGFGTRQTKRKKKRCTRTIAFFLEGGHTLGLLLVTQLKVLAPGQGLVRLVFAGGALEAEDHLLGGLGLRGSSTRKRAEQYTDRACVNSGVRMGQQATSDTIHHPQASEPQTATSKAV